MRQNRDGAYMAMALRILLLALLALTASGTVAHAQTVPSPAPSPALQPLSDAWWTGPMLAPGAGTMPRGHVLVEPYFYDVMQYGSYAKNGALSPAPHSNGYGNLTYIIYGVTNRLSVGLIPTESYTTTSNNPSSSHIGFGDLGVTAQYRLLTYHLGSWIPTTSVAIQETLPTGKYDNLGSTPNDGIGSGVYATKLSLYTQSYAWLRSRRILRVRLNLSETFSGTANVNNASVYGTANGFRGTAKPGDSLSVDVAGEYSITRNWVVASDLVFGYSGNTLVSGNTGLTNLGDSHSFAFAPAVEYNWTGNSGILFGLRYFPTGRNSGASLSPAIAINMVR